MGIKKKALDLLGDVIETAGKGPKKGPKKSGKQDDLFPETIPTTSEATKAADKLSAAEKRKFRKSQTDMFSDELKDATEARKVQAAKKRKNAMKPKKKAEGGLVENFAVGGAIKTLWKNRPRVKTVKETEALKKKKTKTETKSGPVNKSSDFDPGSKHLPLMKKQEEIRKKVASGKYDMPTPKKKAKGHYGDLRRKKAKGKAGGGVVKKYAGGGTVRKSIDGIAQRGLTRANHK